MLKLGIFARPPLQHVLSSQDRPYFHSSKISRNLNLGVCPLHIVRLYPTSSTACTLVSDDCKNDETTNGAVLTHE